MANVDLNRVERLSPEVEAIVDDLFEYHPWDASKLAAGVAVRKVLADAVKVIINNVPPCPTRTVAIRKIVEARMDCNAAITHGGRF